MRTRRLALAGFLFTVTLWAQRVTVTLAATTDLHGQVYPYDYYTGRPANRGLAKIAALVREARAGSRNLDPGPNLLRILLGEPAAGDRSAPAGLLQDRIVVAETSIDDMNPELFGYVMEKLFAAGALDVIWIPIHMKKNRPGTLLQVLCRPDLLEAIVDCILTETTSLGVRHYEAGRCMLPRSAETIETSFGKVAVKRVCSTRGEIRRVPEYEECRRVALEQNLPIRVVYDRIAGEANNLTKVPLPDRSGP